MSTPDQPNDLDVEDSLRANSAAKLAQLRRLADTGGRWAALMATGVVGLLFAGWYPKVFALVPLLAIGVGAARGLYLSRLHAAYIALEPEEQLLYEQYSVTNHAAREHAEFVRKASRELVRADLHSVKFFALED